MKEFLVECLLCKEIVKCQRNDTINLVDHIHLKHPDITISGLPNELNKKIKENQSRENQKITGKRLQKIMQETEKVNKSEDKPTSKSTENKVENNSTRKQQRKVVPKGCACTKTRKLYKTSVEKWKPGDEKILCPKCDANVRIMIRTSSDRVSHSPIGAAVLMACWPFCFLPFLFPAPTQEHLHCSICGFYFGMYDYEKQVMIVRKEPIKKN